MAHNLMEIGNNQHAHIYNALNGIPWHVLGTPLQGCFSLNDVLKTVPVMNMHVSKRQLSIKINGVYQLVDAWGIFRDDNDLMLASVGNQYTIIQVRDAFDFVDTLLENVNGAHYDTAGILYQGQQFFISASIPYSIAPDRAPDDKTHCYLMFTSSHDGSLSATTKLTTVRTVCANTLSLALNTTGFGTLKVKHSSGGQDKLNRAKKMITGMTQTVETLKEKFNKLANRKISKDQNMMIMDKLFGKDWQNSTQKKNQVEKIATLFSYNDGNAFPEIAGSAYSMLQSITNYVDHHRGIRKTDKVSNLSEDQIRTQNALFNGGDTLKQQALEVVLAATANSEQMPERHVYQSVDIPKKPIDSIDSIMSMVS